MAQLNKLLLAIDLNSETELLISRVLKMCRDDLAHLHVVHVIKRGLHDISHDDIDPNHDAHAQRLFDHTKIRLREVLYRNGMEVPSERIYLTIGEPSFEIKKLAREIEADMVIVGSHSKEDDCMHLPGATTNCVIQGISSNVMAVKV